MIKNTATPCVPFQITLPNRELEVKPLERYQLEWARITTKIETARRPSREGMSREGISRWLLLEAAGICWLVLKDSILGLE